MIDEKGSDLFSNDNKSPDKPAVDNTHSPFKEAPQKTLKPLTEAINKAKELRGEPVQGKHTLEDLLNITKIEGDIARTTAAEEKAKKEELAREAGILRAESGIKDSVITQYQSMNAEAEARAAEAEEQSTIDEKTNLYNEKGFRLALDRTLAEIKRTGEPLALLFLDLDGFKGVNDKLGHAVGDKILGEVAKRLKGYLRETDLIARIGGDEFVAALKANLPDVLARIENVRESDLPDQINDALVRMGENPDGIRVSTSMGGAQYGPEINGYEDLKTIADARMYEDKNSRKERYKREAV